MQDQFGVPVPGVASAMEQVLAAGAVGDYY